MAVPNAVVRELPAPNGPVVTGLTQGTIVCVLGREAGTEWYIIDQNPDTRRAEVAYMHETVIEAVYPTLTPSITPTPSNTFTPPTTVTNTPIPSATDAPPTATRDRRTPLPSSTPIPTITPTPNTIQNAYPPPPPPFLVCAVGLRPQLFPAPPLSPPPSGFPPGLGSPPKKDEGCASSCRCPLPICSV